MKRRVPKSEEKIVETVQMPGPRRATVPDISYNKRARQDSMNELSKNLALDDQPLRLSSK